VAWGRKAILDLVAYFRTEWIERNYVAPTGQEPTTFGEKPTTIALLVSSHTVNTYFLSIHTVAEVAE
jgi:hypothetical protein